MKTQVTISAPTKEKNGFVAYRTNQDIKRVSIVKISNSKRNNGVVGYINPSGHILTNENVHSLITREVKSKIMATFF